MDKSIQAATLRLLLTYCQANNWAGYEPYDALNSPIVNALPFVNARLPQLILTQALKRSPIDIRSLLLIPKTQNPKAIGLFLSGFVKLSNIGIVDHEYYIGLMVDRLVALRSQNVSYWCWGYNFPWQTRTVFVPRWVPNLVCTAFAASGLLDAYEQHREPRYLSMAVSAAEYILDELYWTGGKGVCGLGYPLPTVRLQIHNANLLAASLFCRVHRHTGERKFLEAALRVARYSVGQQHTDGSWDYGEGAHQRWIDNIHTGFNLCALQTIARCAETTEFESCIRRGLEFYRSHFFREDGAVRYFHNCTYPIDAHCVAQSIITLLDLKELDPSNVQLAHSVFQWTMDHMWDDRGFFYYRILRSCKIRTSYMRWTQAWMFLALSMLLSEPEAASHRVRPHDAIVLAEVTA
jgi:hypothetical protein